MRRIDWVLLMVSIVGIIVAMLLVVGITKSEAADYIKVFESEHNDAYMNMDTGEIDQVFK